MKVIKSTVNPNQLSSEIELFDESVTDTAKEDIQQQVGQFLVDAILETVVDAKSPVTGRNFKKLTKDYAEKKVEEGGNPIPNLDLFGDMLNDLTFRPTDNGIEIGYFNSDQAGKADGHNNFSGESRIPTRRFIPFEEENFTRRIQDQAKQLITNILADEIELDQQDLQNVENKQDLYELLALQLPDLKRSEIKTLVLNSPDLTTILEDNDLLDLL